MLCHLRHNVLCRLPCGRKAGQHEEAQHHPRRSRGAPRAERQEQVIHLHTTWCGTRAGGYITSRSSWTSHDTTFCSGSGDYANHVSGGVGYSSVTVEGGAYFACPTGIPWLETHWHVWEQIWY